MALSNVRQALAGPNRDVVLWLIEHGADLNERCPDLDDTAMSRAVVDAPPDLLCELIDKYGCDAHRGQLLHDATRRTGDDVVGIMRLPLDRGAPLNLTMYADDAASLHNYHSIDLGTPLHMAARMGDAAAVKFLLSQGADASICSTKGKTALQWAQQSRKRNNNVVAILRSPD